MVWYGVVNVDLYSAIITKVSNALIAKLIAVLAFTGVLGTDCQYRVNSDIRCRFVHHQKFIILFNTTQNTTLC